MDTTVEETEGQEAVNGETSIPGEYAVSEASEESGPRYPDVQQMGATRQMEPRERELWELDPADPNYPELMRRAFLAWLRGKPGTYQ